MLAEKAKWGLYGEEREFAKVIYTSGNDLMMLINDILDLSKVEAGKLEVFFNEANIREIAETVERSFLPMAEQKGLTFTVEIEEDLLLFSIQMNSVCSKSLRICFLMP